MAKKTMWRIDRNDETGFFIITDPTGMERFRGKTKVIPTYLAMNMKELDETRKKLDQAKRVIKKMKEERKDLRRRCGDDIPKPTKKRP